MDSDLAESISALKESFSRRGVRATFGKADAALVDGLKAKLSIPRRYREFLLACDPTDVETRTPSERVRLVSAQNLVREQVGFALISEAERRPNPAPNGWRPSWIIIGHSTLVGDPYFLDVSLPDPEGDCPVYTAMSGSEPWKAHLCASSFALFLRILAVGMQVAEGFAEDNLDIDDEQVFRESLGPKVREYDPAAFKAGHWT
ncbi:MAG: SMI1/KNR4 family protein [Polyangiaceae bacterium]|nr:SMI1/KNR4 family protein [Polyangiaceae bacterium]